MISSKVPSHVSGERDKRARAKDGLALGIYEGITAYEEGRKTLPPENAVMASWFASYRVTISEERGVVRFRFEAYAASRTMPFRNSHVSQGDDRVIAYRKDGPKFGVFQVC